MKNLVLLGLIAFSALYARQYAVGKANICKPARGYFDFNLSDNTIPKNFLCVNNQWFLYRPNGGFVPTGAGCACVDKRPNNRK
jgi:hypothetical protein